MKLQQLQVLVAVVEQGGIRAAARALHLSQAAVTKSMRLLEEEAGVPLLLRRSRGVDLTEAGARLLARARVITRQVALARDDLRQAAGEDAGSVRLGVTPFVTLSGLGEAFRWFRQRYQDVQDGGQRVVSLPLMRDLLQARAAFEEAKEAQDADKVGRILTYVEGRLKQL